MDEPFGDGSKNARSSSDESPDAEGSWDGREACHFLVLFSALIDNERN